MPRSRRETSEQEFQGSVLEWLNREIRRRPGLRLDRATQEKPRRSSGKRSDIVVWRNRATTSAFLAIELKTVSTPLNDPVLFADAAEKAQFWRAPYFAIWNMREAELYSTPPPGASVTPAQAIRRWPPETLIRRVEDWLSPAAEGVLGTRAIEILDAAWADSVAGMEAGPIIDAELFVTRLGDGIGQLRDIVYRGLTLATRANARLRRQVNSIAAEQGFKGFVEDIEFAIAGQLGYRLIGQILFYFALRRKQPSLPPLRIERDAVLPDALYPFWNDVRRFDYEALFRPDPIDQLIPIPADGQSLIRSMIAHLATYDWASLTDDVLGAVFERLIPHDEQILLGQFYTPRPVADFLVAMTVHEKRGLILDPGCGSGTFLMSAYDCLAWRSGLTHRELLSAIWGFDLSPFATELAAINLFRQDMAEFDNFPRIVPGNFFSREPGQEVAFPPSRPAPGGAAKVAIPIPRFDCIVGNPPYLRSQNQDDLDQKYRDELFAAAARVGIRAGAKTDLFAFFIYHAMRFLPPGGRLGFVTPASWLNADYAAALQRLLLDELRLVAIVGSEAEAFFPQVDINTVLLVAERADITTPADGMLRFVTLRKRLAELVAHGPDRWRQLTELADDLVSHRESVENDQYRVKVVPAQVERAVLSGATTPRNWSKYMRAPLSYYQLFGGVA